MRIIAGEHRGRKLLPPEGDATRPITDRAKQSLFDILTPLLPDAAVYDCFAGTGSMGLESLSRGAAMASFFESDRSALARLKNNIETLRVADRARIVPGDLFRHLANSTPPRPADLIFLDPPYRFLRQRAEDLRELAKHLAERHLSPQGMVVFRHDSEDSLDLPPLLLADQRTYGGMTIDFLRR